MGSPGIRHLIQHLIDRGRPVAVDRRRLGSPLLLLSVLLSHW